MLYIKKKSGEAQMHEVTMLLRRQIVVGKLKRQVLYHTLMKTKVIFFSIYGVCPPHTENLKTCNH